MRNEDEIYMQIAEVISQASYAHRMKVGAVIVLDGNIVSFGYNGTPNGFNNECEVDGVTKAEVLHAESNAIAKCAKTTSSCEGATLYVTLSPCLECAKLIIQCDIVRVVYKDLYRDTTGLDLLSKTNIQVHGLRTNPERL